MKEDKETKEKIEECEKKIEELENNWKRALADYRNLEKRTEEEKQKWVDFSNENLIRHLLPIIDGLYMMQEHVKNEGLGMVIKQMNEVLMDNGVTEIETLSTDFDHTKMEAVELVGGEQNKVVEVITRGYFFKNKLLRPARVKVGNGETTAEKKN